MSNTRKLIPYIEISLVQRITLKKKLDIPKDFIVAKRLAKKRFSSKEIFPLSCVGESLPYTVRLSVPFEIKSSESNFVANYFRSNGGISIDHFIKIKSVVKHGTDLTLDIPVILSNRKPLPEIEQTLQRPQPFSREIPSIHNLRSVYWKMIVDRDAYNLFFLP